MAEVTAGHGVKGALLGDVYVSIDVETDGPIPGKYSMLSLGAAAFNEDGEQIGSVFEINLERLPGAMQHPATMEFWRKNPEAYRAAQADAVAAREAMARFLTWVESLGGCPIALGYPATWDFMFVYWYLEWFGLKSPFGFSALDMKSYASAVLDMPFRDVTKKSMPKSWLRGARKHTHVASDDAIGQGELFFRMREANRVKKKGV